LQAVASSTKFKNIETGEQMALETNSDLTSEVNSTLSKTLAG
jgi:hypothetical protein